MNKFKKICNRMGIPVRLGVTVIILVAVYILIAVVLILVIGWEHIRAEWVRNGLFVGVVAVVGLWFAYRPNDAMDKQVKIADRHADLAEKRYASEQFSQSITLLAKDDQNGKPAIEARIGGVYALAKLAEADPKGYGAQVMKALVDYIRNNAQLTALPVPSKNDKDELTTNSKERSEAAHLGADVKTAFAELKRLHSNRKVRKDSNVNDDDISFSYADFRVLRLNEIEWIERPDLSYANLSGADLVSAKLQGANLNGANLQGADLWQANLQGAHLYTSYLKGASLVEAELQGVDLRWADLKNARLRSADLKGAFLVKAELQDADLRWVDLKGARLQSADLSGTNLRHANLQGAKLFSVNLQGSNLGVANLQGAGLRSVKLQDANLNFTQLQGANLRGANLQGANLEEAELQGANLELAELQGANLIAAITLYTVFENAEFDKSTAFGDNAKEWKVWCDNDPLLLERGVQPLALDAEWDLDLIFPEKIEPSDIVFILEGILRNFADRDNKERCSDRAYNCRKAVKQRVEKYYLWNYLSDSWRDWLRSLDNRGYAPDDK